MKAESKASQILANMAEGKSSVDVYVKPGDINPEKPEEYIKKTSAAKSFAGFLGLNAGLLAVTLPGGGAIAKTIPIGASIAGNGMLAAVSATGLAGTATGSALVVTSIVVGGVVGLVALASAAALAGGVGGKLFTDAAGAIFGNDDKSADVDEIEFSPKM